MCMFNMFLFLSKSNVKAKGIMLSEHVETMDSSDDEPEFRVLTLSLSPVRADKELIHAVEHSLRLCL